MSYLNRARELQDEAVEIRRHLHQYPELGYDTVETSKFVRKKLEEYGYSPDDMDAVIENSVVVTIGKGGGKTIMLRADMDALPIEEDTGLDFSSKHEGKMHACGHDVHTTTLLTVARLLKENEDKINGTVKLLFQPAEELLNGAETMIKEGLLEKHKPDFAMAAHVAPVLKKGLAFHAGNAMAGALNFKMTIKGESTHGAMPYLGIDPVYVGSQIITALQGIISREIDFKHGASITVGKFDGNGAINLIPDQAILEGTARSFSNRSIDHMKKRIPEIADHIAKAHRAEVEVEFKAHVPVLLNDEKLTTKVEAIAKEIFDGEYEVMSISQQNGSEDFAFISQEIPSVYFNVGMKDSDIYKYNVHNSKVIMNEEMIAPAAALFVESTLRYLDGKL